MTTTVSAPPSAVPSVSVLNLPNVLTLGRLALVPVFVALLLLGDSDALRYTALAVFTVACVTDVIDGRLARSRGLVTDFGKLVDPIADKTLVGAALIGLSLLGELPWWATGVVIGRELLVTVMRLAVKRHGVIAANRGGKLKAFAQNSAVTLYLLPLAGVAALRLPVLVLAVTATVLTGLDYAQQAARLSLAAR